MNKTIKRHADAIQSGTVDRSNVIGLRKAFNAYERQSMRLSTSRTAPTMTDADRESIEQLLADIRPVVAGQLSDSGFALLRNPRYRKQLASVADIIADLQTIKLVGFYCHDSRMLNYVPVYRACDSKGKSFPFYCVPWQSGGNGPQVASGNYF